MNIENTASSAPQHRSVAAERGVGWITDAWPLFRDQAGLWVLLTVITIGITLVCSLVPLLGSLAMPFVSTVVLAGMLLVARKQRSGATPEIGDLFAILSHPALTRLLIVTLIYVALSFGAFIIVFLAFGMGSGAMALTSLMAGGDTAGAVALGGGILFGMLVYLAIIVPILAMYWYAVPLVLFCNAEPWPAMLASLRAVVANMVPFLVYGVITLFLMVLATIPLMLGLLVALPLVLLSWLISFDEIFAQGAPPAKSSGIEAL